MKPKKPDIEAKPATDLWDLLSTKPRREPVRWECGTKNCHWEYSHEYVIDNDYTCGGCGKRNLRRKASSAAIAYFVSRPEKADPYVLLDFLDAVLSMMASGMSMVRANTAYLLSIAMHSGMKIGSDK